MFGNKVCGNVKLSEDQAIICFSLDINSRKLMFAGNMDRHLEKEQEHLERLSRNMQNLVSQPNKHYYYLLCLVCTRLCV